MATINPPTNIASGGASTWEFKVEAGREYLITLKGTYGASSLSLLFESQSNPGNFEPIDGATYDGVTKSEDRFISPTGMMRLQSSGSIGPISIHVTPTFVPECR